MLAKDRIRDTVAYLCERARFDGRTFRYTVTTNGSLLDDDFIGFMANHRFRVYLSFDGPSQDRLRQRDSFRSLRRRIDQLKGLPAIDLALNSVITPSRAEETVNLVESLVETGVPEFRIAFDMTRRWSEEQFGRLELSFDTVRKLLGHIRRRTGENPFLNFQEIPSSSVFCCDGGRDRLALAPGPVVWGCHRTWGYFTTDTECKDAGELCFGNLDSFIDSFDSTYSSTMKHYAILRHDFARTPTIDCIDCPEVGECGICPFTAAAFERRLGKIPGWVCRLLTFQRLQRRLFYEENL